MQVLCVAQWLHAGGAERRAVVSGAAAAAAQKKKRREQARWWTQRSFLVHASRGGKLLGNGTT